MLCILFPLDNDGWKIVKQKAKRKKKKYKKEQQIFRL